jgi:hypothetical protein
LNNHDDKSDDECLHHHEDPASEHEPRDTGNEVIDLCSSQCSPRPALQPVARNHSVPTCSLACTVSERAKGNTRSAHASRNDDRIRCMSDTAANSSCSAKPTAPNALKVLMQSARCPAAAPGKSGVPQASTPTDALRLLMRGSRQNAQEHRGNGVASRAGAPGANPRGARTVKNQGRARKKSGRVGGDTGVEVDACATWVSVKSSGPVHILEVPYSEHSSFNELRCALD